MQAGGVLMKGKQPNRLDDITKNCLDEFRRHWECLEDNNQQLWQCRTAEWKLNGCVFDKLGLEKTLPGAPKDEPPVHLLKRQIYSRQKYFKEDE
ncbi:MAG: hypothetical protein Q9214_003142 [Letrouitia sp. 1 TL-2023]